MKIILHKPAALLSILMTASLLLSGVHAKDVSALTYKPAAEQGAKKVLSHDDQGQNTQSQKASVDSHLHNHIDKQTLKSAMKSFSDQNPQIDTRSLRKVRNGRARKAKKQLNLKFLLQPLNSLSL